MSQSKYMLSLEKKVNDKAVALKKTIEKQLAKLEDYDVAYSQVLGREEYQECLCEGGEDLANGNGQEVVDERAEELRELLAALERLPLSVLKPVKKGKK